MKGYKNYKACTLVLQEFKAIIYIDIFRSYFSSICNEFHVRLMFCRENNQRWKKHNGERNATSSKAKADISLLIYLQKYSKWS